MNQITRWVHPRKVDNKGRLRPSAFPLEQLIKAMDIASGNLDSGTISLASFSLLTKENRAVAKKNACAYCARAAHNRYEWNDAEECDCDKSSIGARGACAPEDVLLASGFFFKNAVNEQNPLHVLLYKREACDVDDVQSLLLEYFSSIHTVKSLLG